MGEKTGIEWTDATWNPWHGCHKISPGCKNCYMFRDKRRYGQNPNAVTRSSSSTFRQPFRWKEPLRIFTCSWSDFFIEEADQWRDDAWDIIQQTPHHTYLILTKRPRRILDCLPADWNNGWSHVWLGVSVENQQTADERRNVFAAVPSAHKFVSYEPALESVDWQGWEFLDWLIAGGESGAGARRADSEWFRQALMYCRQWGIDFFMKQMSQATIPDFKKFEMFPPDLRVREIPKRQYEEKA